MDTSGTAYTATGTGQIFDVNGNLLANACSTETAPRFLINSGGSGSRRHAEFRVVSSHNDAMRTGPAVIVQRGDFVIAGGCGPLENLIRCSFANELLAGEPEDFTRIGIGLWRVAELLCRNEQNFFAVRRDNDRFFSGPTGQLAASLRQRGRRNSAWNSGLLEQREKRRARIRKLRISVG